MAQMKTSSLSEFLIHNCGGGGCAHENVKVVADCCTTSALGESRPLQIEVSGLFTSTMGWMVGFEPETVNRFALLTRRLCICLHLARN
jgi:hypothetical protein